MSLDIPTFLPTISQASLLSLKVEELHALADYYELEVDKTGAKGDIQNQLLNHLRDEGILARTSHGTQVSGETLRHSPHDHTPHIDREFELEFERLRVEREKLANEKENRLAEREKDERKFAYDRENRLAEREKLEIQLEIARVNSQANLHREPDISKFIRFVPRFKESEVDSYFDHFEKTAINLKWPKDCWTSLLQSVIQGKAQEAYAFLSIEDSSKYDVVKAAILQAYELVPEAYRQKFRNYRKFDNQTFAEFARVKETTFDRWCASKDIGEDISKLKQLILIEDFNRCSPLEVKIHVEDHKVQTLREAAKLADEYTLTHKTVFTRNGQNASQGRSQGSQQRTPNNQNGYSGRGRGYDNSSNGQSSQNQFSSYSSADSGSTNRGQSRSIPHSTGYSNSNQSAGYQQQGRPGSGRDSELSGPTCNYCKQIGHVKSECPVLAKKHQQGKQAQGHGCASVFSKPSTTVDSKDSHEVKVKSDRKVDKANYDPFISKGEVSVGNEVKPITILRDTGALQTLIVEGIVPLSDETYTGTSVLMQGIECGYVHVPLHRVELKSNLVSGTVVVGVRSKLPISGVDLLLGNDLAGGEVQPKDSTMCIDPIVCDGPVCESSGVGETLNSGVLLVDDVELYPSCAVTRALSKKKSQSEKIDLPVDEDQVGEVVEVQNEDIGLPEGIDLSETFLQHLDEENAVKDSNSILESQSGDGLDTSGTWSREELIARQKSDPELRKLRNKALSEVEIEDVSIGYYLQLDILMRKWRPPESPADEFWQIQHQIVVPSCYRRDILSLAHDSLLAGHLGVNKTYHKILQNFYWPALQTDVRDYCRTCHTCQLVGKPNQVIHKYPLQPIPAFDEPFSRVMIDCVGPLPQTKSGFKYLLTIMCTSTRFPEAIPLRNIKAKTIMEALTKFFTMFGLPKSLQSDQGSNFMSGQFQELMCELGIRQFKSSPYHPESQGALERFHQTLKNMLRSYCFDHDKDWDKGIPFVLFAARETVQDSLGFSPFQLVFGREVRGPLLLLKEKWVGEDSETNVLEYVCDFKQRMTSASELARKNLESSQIRMKEWYDRKAVKREFHTGEQVLVLLPIPGQPLHARYFGPYTITRKVSDTDYVIHMPNKRKSNRYCHINMIKKYHARGQENISVCTLNTSEDSSSQEVIIEGADLPPSKLDNSKILENLDSKLSHVSDIQKQELKNLIFEFEHLFPDTPTRTDMIEHDIDIGEASPVKQHAYRCNPIRLEQLKSELEYMLENDIIQPSMSPWSSPCILVPKSNGGVRFCTNFKKVNCLSKTDSFPLPRIDDCIDRIGHAMYVTKFDLLKGYWQIPLSARAKQISAFCTPEGLYEYNVMPFGLKNAPATFQRLINRVTSDVPHCDAYIDDVIVPTDSWSEHLVTIRRLFEKLTQAKLTVNLSKSEFVQATVTYLGHVVGQGQVRPVQAKVEAILHFPRPKTKKELMRFLGVAGYYRKFCKNFAQVATPLTNLLKKNVPYVWNSAQEDSFHKIKAILTNEPVLVTPNFEKQFIIHVDACDVGAGAVLQQEDSAGITHPICYFSKKFNGHQRNYSTIEKETLGLILAVQHFEVYISTTLHPVLVHTDHNPLVFVSKMKNKNQRLMRWSIILEQFDLDIVHIKGTSNVIADALSRAFD